MYSRQQTSALLTPPQSSFKFASRLFLTEGIEFLDYTDSLDQLFYRWSSA